MGRLSFITGVGVLVASWALPCASMAASPETTDLSRASLVALDGSGSSSEPEEEESGDPAEMLDEADELFEYVEYQEAAALYLSVAEDPRSTEEQRLEAWAGRAICLAGLDEDEGARDAFVAVLEIDDSYELPAMVSPKIREALQKASLIFAARAPRTEEKTVPPEESLPPDEERKARRGGPSFSSLALAVGASSAVSLGTGGIFGALASRGERRFNEEPDSFEHQREALEYRDTVTGRARTANILYGAGAALAAGAVVLFLMDGATDGGAEGRSRDPSVTVMMDATSDGGLLGFAARW